MRKWRKRKGKKILTQGHNQNALAHRVRMRIERREERGGDFQIQIGGRKRQMWKQGIEQTEEGHECVLVPMLNWLYPLIYTDMHTQKPTGTEHPPTPKLRAHALP